MRRAPLTAAIYLAIAIASFSSRHIPFSFSAGLARASTAPANDADIAAAAKDPEEDSTTASKKPAGPNAAQLRSALLELALPESQPSKTEMCQTLATAAQQQELPVGFFVRLIQQESDFDPKAVSPVGAQGVAQFMPETAQEWGLDDPFDPRQALSAAARFLHALHAQFGNWGLAAAAYNAGMNRIQIWVKKGGKLPEETRHYVKVITGFSAEDWKGGMHKASFTIPARAPCQEFAQLAADAAMADADIPLPRPRAAAETRSDRSGQKNAGKNSKSAVAAAKAKSAQRPAKEPHPRVRVAEKSQAKSPSKAARETKRPSRKGKTQVADAQP